MPNTVVLKGRGIRKEGIAAEGITPGMLVHLNSSGQIAATATAANQYPKNWAVENEVMGWDLTHPYVAGEQILYEALVPGQEIYAVLAASQTIAIGDGLKNNGTGALAKATPATDNGLIVAFAIEAVTTTGSAGRIRVETF